VIVSGSSQARESQGKEGRLPPLTSAKFNSRVLAQAFFCASISGSLYMFPRRDGIIPGGTFEHDRGSLDADANQTTLTPDGNANIMKGLQR
jgi:hypothetical protein